MSDKVLYISTDNDEIITLNGNYIASPFTNSESESELLDAVAASLAAAMNTDVQYVQLTSDELYAEAEKRVGLMNGEPNEDETESLLDDNEFIIEVAMNKIKKGTPMRVYLAGPDLFYPDAAERYQRLKDVCENLGMVAVTPVDNETESPTAEAIRAGNLELIRSCDYVLANLAMFRGPEPDSGTAYECGFAAALGKTIVGYTGDELSTVERANRHQETSTSPEGEQWIDKDGAFIENFGLPVNLMMAAGFPIYTDFKDAAFELFHILRR